MSMKDTFIENYGLNATSDNNRAWREVPNSKRQEHYDAMLAEIEAHEARETLVAPPFNDDMSKDEMVQHLLEFHQQPGGRGITIHNHGVSSNGTKATKDEMIRWHNNQHERGITSAFNVTQKYNGSYYEPVLTISGTLHNHAAIRLNEEQGKVLAAVRDNQKVSGTTLGARDQKVLKELVDNDFGSLKAEMRAFAADSLSAKIADINEEWDAKEKSIPDYATQATTQHRTHSDKVQALRARHQQEMRLLEEAGKDAFDKIAAKAKEEGVDLKEDSEKFFDNAIQQNRQRTVFKAEVEGRKEAIAEATKENTKMVDRALLTVEKQRLTAQRQVLLSSVPDAALPIVESIPDAKTLMVEAQMMPATAEIEAPSTTS